MTDRTAWIKKIFYIFLGFSILYVALFYYGLPMMIDDYAYATNSDAKPLYYLMKAWHPGRHVAELLHIFTDRVLGGLLGGLIRDPLTGIKIARSFIAPLIALLFWLTSALYINFNSKHYKLACVTAILLSGVFPMMYFVFNYYVAYIGSFALASFMWYPFLIYYRDQKLPDFCTKDGFINYTFLGIWFVILYFGTQIHDASNYVWLGMSCALLVYLIYHRVQVRQKPMLYTMLFTHFAFLFLRLSEIYFFPVMGQIPSNV